LKKTLVVMVKEPHPGRVKTRLGAGIGQVPAAWWFRHQTKALLTRLGDPRWDLVLAVSPDREGLNSRVWPVHLPRFPQGRGNLGDRMARVFRTLSVGPIVIIGGDIPGIQRRHIAEAFSALGDHQAVIGPATDGGYWAIGLKRVASVPNGLFDGVRWSSEHALEDTLQSIPDLTVAHLDYLQDVDTVDDLAKLSKH
jgi:rSAM/selenodomain-associated transferase 1